MPTTDGDFNLLDDPWVVVLDDSGAESELSLLEVLHSSHELTTIGGEVPTQTFAITRVLLAFLHRAIDGPAGTKEWGALWAMSILPTSRIEEYADRVRPRFGLFDAERPFMQVTGLRTISGAVSDLAKIIADVPDGERLFTTRTSASLTRLSAAEAARWLVHTHAFDPSGIKSGVVGDPGVKGGKSYPMGTGWAGQLGGVLVEGQNLKETLLLNLLGRDNSGGVLIGGPGDLPAWERPPGGQHGDDREPAGAIDLYTWQSRRIRLTGDASGVTGVVLTNGDKMTPQNRYRFEPHTAWRYSEPQTRKFKHVVWMPREHDPERQVWRGLGGLLSVRAEHRSSEPKRGSVFGPPVLSWLAELTGEELLPSPFMPRVRAIGCEYGSNNSVLDDLVDDSFPLDVALLSETSPELAALAVGAVKDADQAASAVWRLAENLAQAAGAEPKSGAGDAANENAFAVLDEPYRRWLADIHRGLDVEAHRGVWHRTVASRMTTLTEELIAAAPPAAWTGREINGHLMTVPAADALFRRVLYQALPLAGERVPDEEERST